MANTPLKSSHASIIRDESLEDREVEKLKLTKEELFEVYGLTKPIETKARSRIGNMLLALDVPREKIPYFKHTIPLEKRSSYDLLAHLGTKEDADVLKKILKVLITRKVNDKEIAKALKNELLEEIDLTKDDSNDVLESSKIEEVLPVPGTIPVKLPRIPKKRKSTENEETKPKDKMANNAVTKKLGETKLKDKNANTAVTKKPEETKLKDNDANSAVIKKLEETYEAKTDFELKKIAQLQGDILKSRREAAKNVLSRRGVNDLDFESTSVKDTESERDKLYKTKSTEELQMIMKRPGHHLRLERIAAKKELISRGSKMPEEDESDDVPEEFKEMNNVELRRICQKPGANTRPRRIFAAVELLKRGFRDAELVKLLPEDDLNMDKLSPWTTENQRWYIISAETSRCSRPLMESLSNENLLKLCKITNAAFRPKRKYAALQLATRGFSPSEIPRQAAQVLNSDRDPHIGKRSIEELMDICITPGYKNRNLRKQARDELWKRGVPDNEIPKIPNQQSEDGYDEDFPPQEFPRNRSNGYVMEPTFDGRPPQLMNPGFGSDGMPPQFMNPGFGSDGMPPQYMNPGFVDGRPPLLMNPGFVDGRPPLLVNPGFVDGRPPQLMNPMDGQPRPMRHDDLIPPYERSVSIDSRAEKESFDRHETSRRRNSRERLSPSHRPRDPKRNSSPVRHSRHDERSHRPRSPHRSVRSPERRFDRDRPRRSDDYRGQHRSDERERDYKKSSRPSRSPENYSRRVMDQHSERKREYSPHVQKSKSSPKSNPEVGQHKQQQQIPRRDQSKGDEPQAKMPKVDSDRKYTVKVAREDSSKPFSEEDLTLFGELLFNIIRCTDSGPPMIEETIRKGSELIITCANEYSQKWLLQYVPRLMLDGKPLSAVLGNESCLATYQLVFPKTDKPTAELFKMLEAFNFWLDTSQWLVLSSKLESGGRMIIVQVPKKSVEYFADCKFKLFFGLQPVTVVILK